MMTPQSNLEDIFNSLVDSLNDISLYVNGTKISKLGTCKVVMLDLMKRMHSNLYALKVIMPEYFKGATLALPIGLIIRTCVTDALTGFYLLTFSKDENSLQNELNVIGLDYIGYLEKLCHIEPLFMRPDLPKVEREQIIIKKLEEIVEKYPDLIQKRDNLKIIKKTPAEIRATSNEKIFPYNTKYTGPVTDLSKFERLFDYPGEGVRSLSYLYPLFRLYSQFHHYTILTRKLMDMDAKEHLMYLRISLVLILQALNSFGRAIEIPDELLVPIRNIFDSLSDVKEE